MLIKEHSGINVLDLLYNTTSLEFFGIWNSILKKIEVENKRIEQQNKQ